MADHLKPLEPPFSAEAESLLKHYPQSEDGYILKLFRLFANSTRFLAGKGVVNLLDDGSPLSLREREIVILRVTANMRCEYEWGVHVTVFAKAAGLNEQQVEATVNSSIDAECWTVSEKLLIQCVDQICCKASMENSTLEAFQNTWNAEQQLEILALCGNYQLVSMVANTYRIDNEEFAASFPSTAV